MTATTRRLLIGPHHVTEVGISGLERPNERPGFGVDPGGDEAASGLLSPRSIVS